MEVELMVTKRDDDRQPTDRQGEYRAICLGKVGRQSFAKYKKEERHQRKKLKKMRKKEEKGYICNLLIFQRHLYIRYNSSTFLASSSAAVLVV